MKVYSSGLANLLQGERSEVLSTGLTLTVRKLTLNDLAEVETYVLSKRVQIKQAISDLTSVLEEVKVSEIKNALILGAQQAIEDIMRSLSIVTIAESSQFENSREGMSLYLFLAAREKTPWLEKREDAYTLFAMSSGEDLEKIGSLVEWSSMFNALKNSEGPSPDIENQQSESPLTDTVNGATFSQL